jgi:membrane protein
MLRAWIIAKHTFLGFAQDNCSQMAAAITYYVLFSIVPLAIFSLAVVGVFFSGEAARDKVVDAVLDVLPFSETDGRQAVEEAVSGVQDANGTIALLSFAGTLWTASSVFGSIRRSLNAVWGVTKPRPWAQGKLIDFVQIGVLSAVILGSLVLTGVLRTIREVSSERLGPLASDNLLWEFPAVLLPAGLSFLTFALLYRIVPVTHPDWKAALTGAALATILFELLKNTFAIYIANFNNYDVVYGSLAGVLIFLFYMFLASNILLIGAELARTTEQYTAGAFDAEINPPEPLPPVTTRAFRALRGLFLRD